MKNNHNFDLLNYLSINIIILFKKNLWSRDDKVGQEMIKLSFSEYTANFRTIKDIYLVN